MLPAPSGTFLLGFPPSPPPWSLPPVAAGLLSFWSQPVLVHCPVMPTPGHTWPVGSPHSSLHLSPCLHPHGTRATPPPPTHPAALRHLLIRPGGEADLDLSAALPLLPGELGAWTGPWLEGTGEALIDNPLPQTFAYHHSFWAGGEGEGGTCFSRLGFYELSG